ncbi:phosphopantetheine-binding protein [uncultured Mailhella sp.]|uniref:phosphopantetheine-binding protein n=1 Tax=uncultured Mailhella sp. TaxID=1981031 RepID=UPI002630E5F4|nr:phosphopantetheine-binding protein [uncultured Mailhella sp.]
MDKTELINDLKQSILAALPLEDLTESDIQADTPLFEKDGLGLDSLDAVELVVVLEKRYGVVIHDADAAREIFKTLSSLADFILSQKKDHA